MIFLINGNYTKFYEKKVIFPLKMKDPIMPYPFAIHEGTIYQVIEDAEEEEWKVHITKIN